MDNVQFYNSKSSSRNSFFTTLFPLLSLIKEAFSAGKYSVKAQLAKYDAVQHLNDKSAATAMGSNLNLH